MSLQNINVGNIINDGTGDDLRTAFLKVNQNFIELDLNRGQNNTGSNVGTGLGVFREKVGVDLRFKTLLAGTGINLTASTGEITITNTKQGILTVNANTGTLALNIETQSINIVGGVGVSTAISGNTLTITGNTKLEGETTPKLGADLNLNGHNIYGSGNVTATNLYGAVQGNLTGNVTGNVTGNLTGNVTGNVYGIDIRPINDIVYTFDFGPVVGAATNPIQWLLANTAIDMGSFTSGYDVDLDCGMLT